MALFAKLEKQPPWWHKRKVCPACHHVAIGALVAE